MRIVVVLEGGLVQHVLSDIEGVDVAIVDYDTDGADPDDDKIVAIPQSGSDRVVDAFARIESAVANPARVAEMFDAFRCGRDDENDEDDEDDAGPMPGM
jgi:hypothetical protein